MITENKAGIGSCLVVMFKNINGQALFNSCGTQNSQGENGIFLREA